MSRQSGAHPRRRGTVGTDPAACRSCTPPGTTCTRSGNRGCGDHPTECVKKERLQQQPRLSIRGHLGTRPEQRSRIRPACPRRERSAEASACRLRLCRRVNSGAPAARTATSRTKEDQIERSRRRRSRPSPPAPGASPAAAAKAAGAPPPPMARKRSSTVSSPSNASGSPDQPPAPGPGARHPAPRPALRWWGPRRDGPGARLRWHRPPPDPG